MGESDHGYKNGDRGQFFGKNDIYMQNQSIRCDKFHLPDPSARIWVKKTKTPAQNTFFSPIATVDWSLSLTCFHNVLLFWSQPNRNALDQTFLCAKSDLQSMANVLRRCSMQIQMSHPCTPAQILSCFINFRSLKIASQLDTSFLFGMRLVVFLMLLGISMSEYNVGQFTVDFGQVNTSTLPIVLGPQPVVTSQATTLFSMRLYHNRNQNRTLWSGRYALMKSIICM
jgi:hypothetical protein